MNPTPRTTTRWLAALLAAVGAVFVLLPAGTRPSRLVYLVGAAATLAVLVHAWTRLPGASRRSWLVLTIGLGVYIGADLTLLAWRLLPVPPPAFPGAVHLLYPLAAAVLAAGVCRLRRRRTVPDRTAIIDAVLVSAGIGIVVWVLLVQRIWPLLGTTPQGRVQLVLYPLTHLALLAAVSWFAMASEVRRPAHRLVLAGGLALAGTAIVYGILLVLEIYVAGGALDLGWLFGQFLLVAAVAHPSASEPPEPPRPPSRGVAHRRVAVLAAGLLMLPALELSVARDGTDLLVAVVTVVMLLLVTARVWLLLREVDRRRFQELHDQHRRDGRRFEALVRHASDVLVVIDREGTVTYATPSARDMLGEDPLGWSPQRLQEQLHPDGLQDTLRAMRERLVAGDEGPIRLAVRLRDRGERQHHVELVVVDLRDDPDVAGMVLTFRDTTERVELEGQLRHLAFNDTLTGLSNRELFQDRLVHALARARRSGNRIGVLLCDLDDFKDVNDSLGHAAGDELLTVVASRLRGATRQTDTVARLGGDEFAVLCEDVTDTGHAIEVARRILAAAQLPVDVEGRLFTIGVSVGIAVDDGGRSADEVLRDADIALYEAKGKGKHRWSVHRTHMTVRAQARTQLADDLKSAVAAGDIGVAFQPIVSLVDGYVVGFEGLARWDHPERGPIPPSEFVPLAEQTGQIVALGDTVMTTLLTTLRGLLDERPDLVLRVGGNVSARQLRDPRLADRLETLLEELRLDPSMVVLELTESVMLDDPDVAIGVMQRLRALGVRFAVDDFGTGYSSLSYLRQLPVDIVKIDRSFVRDLGRDRAVDDLVRAVIELGRNLRLDVVAEGVETRAQRDLLLEMGCGFAQGYLFGRPVDRATLTTGLLAADAPVVTTDPTRMAVVGVRPGALVGNEHGPVLRQ